MKIAIIGPGAIGSLFYALISRKIKEIYLVAKDDQRVNLLRKEGIVFEGISHKRISPCVIRDSSEAGECDLVILCVKAYDVISTLPRAKELCGKRGFVLSFQNGLGNLEAIAEVVGEDRVLGAVTEQSCIRVKPGHIIHTAEGLTTIGDKAKRTPAILSEIRQVFKECAIPVKITHDIHAAIWGKLLVNAGVNALTALLRVRNSDLLSSEHARSLMRMAVSEAERIAKKKKIRLSFDDASEKVEAVCRSTGDNISSMLQDVFAKRRTEIDFINGAIFRLGQNLNIPTPINYLLYELVKTLEENYTRQVG